MERTKVLFATAPFDGHFNPLTTLALALQQVGYDVRWYTQEKYAPKLAKLQIPHFPFRNALQFHDGNMDELFAKSNFLIEDFTPVSKVMPHCDVYISNIGYSGVLPGIQNRLPNTENRWR
jgi:UDP:flavonoid glycosyltransferase YjiC (YdhE family)